MTDKYFDFKFNDGDYAQRRLIPASFLKEVIIVKNGATVLVFKDEITTNDVYMKNGNGCNKGYLLNDEGYAVIDERYTVSDVEYDDVVKFLQSTDTVLSIQLSLVESE